MKILAIESSCDETGAAVLESSNNNASIKILSNVLSTSLALHAKTGGIIPEIAARQQLEYILPVIEQALKKAGLRHSGLSRISKRSSQFQIPQIDAIAVTYGPGLIGSLLVGVETAKTLSYVWKKPLIPVNHLIGHIYANFVSEIHNSKFIIQNSAADIKFPIIALIVSGGHTDLLLIKRHGSIEWLGGTRDDAAGECFDKIGRLLQLPYPGGPAIESAAKNGNAKAFPFPRPLIGSGDLDFSFSGLKTAVYREVSAIKQFNNLTISNISASVQAAIIDVLVKKTIKAAEKYNAKSILLGGGVSANSALRKSFELNARRLTLDAKVFFPEKKLCTDNAAMIGAAAFFYDKQIPWQNLTANPELYFD